MLVAGATGTIGSALVEGLRCRGHVPVPGVRDVQAAARRWPDLEPVALDFTATDASPELAGIDVVVNAVGIFREHGSQRFDALHVKGPVALFNAAAGSGTRVVQVSALGAAKDAGTAYLRSKGEADAVLAALPLTATVVRPSLVFAPDGASTRLFAMLSVLPLLPLPAGGRDLVQPIHLDDLCDAILSLVEDPAPPVRVDAVGPRALRLRDYLAQLGRSFGAHSRVLPVPRAIARASAALAARVSRSPIDGEALRMLEGGSTADPAGIAGVLGRPPRDAGSFIDAGARAAIARRARLDWLLPLLRWSVAATWIVTAIVSAFVYPVEGSLALLARTGLHGGIALLALYGAAALDGVLGVATLLAKRRRWLYRAQAALIAGYTVAISLWLPEFWAHPYGPVLKNIPMLAAIALLHSLEDDPWTT